MLVSDCKPLDCNIECYFKKIQDVGNGSYGVVYSANVTEFAKNIVVGSLPNIVAIKKIPYADTTKDIICNEIYVLKQLQRYYGSFKDKNNNIYIVMDLIPGKELYFLIHDGNLNSKQKFNILLALAHSIADLHKEGLIHRDLKPENIIVQLLDEDKIKLTIIDYGFAYNTADPSCRKTRGTRGYNDPRVISGNYDSMIAADWWSFGHIIYALYTATLLFDDADEVYSKCTDSELMLAGMPLAISQLIIRLTDPTVEQNDRPKIRDIFSSINAHKMSFYEK